MISAKEFSLSKNERIFLRNDIKLLQEDQKKSFIAYPFRVLFRTFDLEDLQNPQVSILVSVPKKRYKHAVDRNLFKRRTREAYRIHKELFGTLSIHSHCGIHLFFQLVDNERPDFLKIEEGILKAHHKLQARLLSSTQQ